MAGTYKYSWYLSKEWREFLGEHLSKIKEGEFSDTISECVARSFKDVAKKKRNAIRKELEEWDRIIETLEGKEEEMIEQREENKGWFDNHVDHFVKNRNNLTEDGIKRGAREWATSPLRRKDLKEHGFTPEEFVAAVEKGREESKNVHKINEKYPKEEEHEHA